MRAARRYASCCSPYRAGRCRCRASHPRQSWERAFSPNLLAVRSLTSPETLSLGILQGERWRLALIVACRLVVTAGAHLGGQQMDLQNNGAGGLGQSAAGYENGRAGGRVGVADWESVSVHSDIGGSLGQDATQMHGLNSKCVTCRSTLPSSTNPIPCAAWRASMLSRPPRVAGFRATLSSPRLWRRTTRCAPQRRTTAA